MLLGDAAHPIEDLAVSAVDAVKIAERQNRVDPAHRSRIVGEVDNVHSIGTQNSKLRTQNYKGPRLYTTSNTKPS